jgi:hypothetical protein
VPESVLSIIMVTAIAILLSSIAAPQGRVPAKPVEAVPPVLTMTGDRSRMPGPRAVVCGDQKSLDGAWTRHTGEPAKVYYSSSPAPLVDFKRYMVVLIFEGASSNIQGIKFEPITQQGEALLIRYTNYGFQTAGPDGGGVLVQPWGLAVLPRSDKKLILEIGVLDRIGGVPKWTKQAEIGLRGPTDSYKSAFDPVKSLPH